jgi:hypothetical protein
MRTPNCIPQTDPDIFAPEKRGFEQLRHCNPPRLLSMSTKSPSPPREQSSRTLRRRPSSLKIWASITKSPECCRDSHPRYSLPQGQQTTNPKRANSEPLAAPQVLADHFPLPAHHQSNQKAMPLRSLTTDSLTPVHGQLNTASFPLCSFRKQLINHGLPRQKAQICNKILSNIRFLD